MRKIVIFIGFITILYACKPPKGETMTQNPLLVDKFETPFGVPAFDQIKPEHFMPAFNEAMNMHNEEIQAIVEDANKPDFDNTIKALALSGGMLNRVESIFSNLQGSDGTDAIQEIAKEITPILSGHYDNISMNAKLFERVKSVYSKKDELGLEGEDARLLEKTYEEFERGGANLAEDKKAEIKQINEQLSAKTLQFTNNLLKETNSFKLVIEKEEELAGLPESVKSAAAETATEEGMEGKWIFTLHKPSWIPFLTYADNRDLREKIYKAMYNRCNNGNEFDNNKLITEITNLRIKKAHIMGYSNWSEFMLSNRMAKKPGNVYNLLNQIWEPALKVAKSEAADMQKMIDEEGGDFKLESWDWWYYAEKIRKQRFDLDEEQLRPYFELNNVREGAFYAANQLFGLTFKEIKDVPVFNPEARCFEVKDADGSHVGVLYMDFHPRKTKRGGAWMSSFRKQQHDAEGNDIRPVIVNICNFSKPTGDKPALLSYEEVETLFHEFGHGLHGLLSKCKYYKLSGTSVERDFVELPSQVMEHWAAQPELLKVYAKHYQTGEVIPQELVDKITAASKFNQGFATVEYLAASLLDMKYQTLTEETDLIPSEFEEKAMEKIGLISSIIPRYKSTYFQHIFSNPTGYSSGYYSYIWAEVLDADAFEAFKEVGNIFDQKTASSFRTNILENGGSTDAEQMYLSFRGKQPGIEALLANRGLN
ncbi:MAG: M3 family metallopeptidase [Bacteroidales bacterium]|nr:M3 family metallopeptidase [Bacteroidales bacterium]